MRNQSFLAQICEASPKFCPNSWKAHFAPTKGHTERGLDLKNFKCELHTLFSGVLSADVMLDMLHNFELISVQPCLPSCSVTALQVQGKIKVFYSY